MASQRPSNRRSATDDSSHARVPVPVEADEVGAGSLGQAGGEAGGQGHTHGTFPTARASATLMSNPAPRRPGRPAGSARGPEQREKLLDSALALFARQGIVDTTLGAIAREAGMTSAMVHYYFNTRDQLLDVLIDERILPLRIAIGEAFRDNLDDPVAAITEVAKRLLDRARSHPWFAPIWVREVISDGGLLKQRMDARFGVEHQRESIARIERWQREGRLNPDLEPSLVFMSLFGLTVLPFASGKALREGPLRQHITADHIARHAIALLVGGLGARRDRDTPDADA